MRTSIILLSLAYLAASCGQGGKAVQSHDHEEEEVKQLTMFTDSAEFYVEHPHMTEGHVTEFLVHLTRLNDYKPYSQGSIRITLEFGDNKSIATAEEPVIPGIWLVELTPEYSGSCRIVFEYTDNSSKENFIYSKGLVEGHNHENAINQGNGQTLHQETPPEGIHFTKEQAWKSEFLVEYMEPASFQGIIRAGGEILAMPGEKYFIHSMNAGIVNYLKENLVAGSDVDQGENIISVEGKGLVNENIALAYEEARTRFEQSRSEYSRHVRLFRENVVSEKEFIAGRSAYVTDSIRYYNLKMSYEEGGLKISSPIGGHIHDLLVSQGEFVEAGQLIATVSSDRRLLLRADVPQQYFNRIGDITTTNFRTSYQDNVWGIEDFNGKLIAVGSSVKENDQYLPVYFEADNNGELLEGAFAEFFLKTSLQENCIVVPSQAVLEEQGKYFVYVQAAGETFQKRMIIPGEYDGFNYHIIQGIGAGERIVTQGGMLVKAASLSTGLPGHSHDH